MEHGDAENIWTAIKNLHEAIDKNARQVSDDHRLDTLGVMSAILESARAEPYEGTSWENARELLDYVERDNQPKD